LQLDFYLYDYFKFIESS